MKEAPKDLATLVADLGIKPPQLEKLRVKHKSDDALLAWLRETWTETREEVRLLARRSVQGYTEVRGQAMPGSSGELGYQDEPEAVDEVTQKRLTQEARQRERGEVADLISAAKSTLKAIEERSEVQPGLKRAYWPLRRELDRLIQREKRRAA